MSRALRSLLVNSVPGKRRFHSSSYQWCFHESVRSGYPAIYDNKPEVPKTLIGKIRAGYEMLTRELKLFWEEQVEMFRADPLLSATQEGVDVVWKFASGEKARNEWVVTCDSDYNMGNSFAKLELSPQGTGIFHGFLDYEPPKDGKTAYAGYANITTVRKYKSFARDVSLDWTRYTHLVLRVRGDGRGYMVNILQKGTSDLTWNIMHHYVMYTTGGPYWQTVVIPFSRFVFGYKGAVQDEQVPIELTNITNIGITASDKVPGPFKLEIDYIGVAYSSFHFEDVAYETYDMEADKK